MSGAATGRYHFFGLIAVALLLVAAPPARGELRLADAMSLRLPAVADALGLSKEQRRRVQKLTREHGAAYATLLWKYPRGSQDNEGEAIRSRLCRQLSERMSSVRADLLAVLEPKQRAALERRGRARFWDGAPTGTIEPFRHWEPAIFDRIGLTQHQWAALPKPRAVKPLSITLDREPTEKERRDLAERIVALFAQRDRAARAVLTEEQRLIVDEWHKAQRGPRFYLLTDYDLRKEHVERLRPAGGTGTTLTVEGCF